MVILYKIKKTNIQQLKEYFKKNGLNYITAATNHSTNKTYWLFEGNEKLNTLLQKWRLDK